MEAIDFLRKRYNVPPDKQLAEILQRPMYTWGDVCELLEDFAQSSKLPADCDKCSDRAVYFDKEGKSFCKEHKKGIMKICKCTKKDSLWNQCHHNEVCEDCKGIIKYVKPFEK